MQVIVSQAEAKNYQSWTVQKASFVEMIKSLSLAKQNECEEVRKI